MKGYCLMPTLLQNFVEIVTSTGGLTLIALFFGVILFLVIGELFTSPIRSTDAVRRIPSMTASDTDSDLDSDGW